MKYLITLIGVLIIGAGAYLYITPQEDGTVTSTEKQYASPTYGVSFTYPTKYFEYATDHEGERRQHTITLLEDTEENRDLVNGKAPGREGPPAITIAMYQNDLDNYTTETFIRDTNFSNFKLSDGTLRPVTIGGETALRYHASGLYENENVVIAHPDYVYMFTVNYLSPEDAIIGEFEVLLASVKFTNDARTPTSADNAPPGSMHNLPVPPAVAAVKKHAAEKFGVPEGRVIVMTAFEKEWSDSCLGLGGPAESCAFMMTPGWEVTVAADGKESVFRTNSDGSSIRAER